MTPQLSFHISTWYYELLDIQIALENVMVMSHDRMNMQEKLGQLDSYFVV